MCVETILAPHVQQHQHLIYATEYCEIVMCSFDQENKGPKRVISTKTQVDKSI